MAELQMPAELPACNVCKEPDCKRIPAIAAFHRSGKALTEQMALSIETDACYARKDAAEKAKDAEIARLRACIADVKELAETLKLPRAKAYGLVRASLVAIIAKHEVGNV